MNAATRAQIVRIVVDLIDADPTSERPVAELITFAALAATVAL